MRREPVLLIVSHVLSDLLYTLNCLPQYSSISGMNGSASNRPCESSVRKISASLRTSTVSPGRSRKLVAFSEPTCSIQSFLILASVTEGNAPISWEKRICLLKFYPGRRRWTQAWTLHVQARMLTPPYSPPTHLQKKRFHSKPMVTTSRRSRASSPFPLRKLLVGKSASVPVRKSSILIPHTP